MPPNRDITITREMRAAGAAAIEEFTNEGFVAWDEVAARVWIAMEQARKGEEVTGAPFFLSRYGRNMRKIDG